MADFSCMHGRCRVGLPLFNMMKKTLLPTAVACFLGAVSHDEVVKVVVFRFLRKLSPNTRVLRGSYTQKLKNNYFYYFNLTVLNR